MFISIISISLPDKIRLLSSWEEGSLHTLLSSLRIFLRTVLFCWRVWTLLAWDENDAVLDAVSGWLSCSDSGRRSGMRGILRLWMSSRLSEWRSLKKTLTGQDADIEAGKGKTGLYLYTVFCRLIVEFDFYIDYFPPPRTSPNYMPVCTAH